MAYTNSPLVSYTKLSPNHSGQRTHSIDRITPHCVVGQCSVETLGNVFQQLIELCTDICKRNGKTKLLWLGDKDKTLNYSPKQDEMVLTVHRWFANKSCPGDWMYARMGDLAEKVTAALGGQASAPLDNAPAAWSKDAVNWALENHLLLGDTNGNLKLRENLSREQFCVMLKRYHDMLQK